jgi:REP element-mobilizing transposase RayT
MGQSLSNIFVHLVFSTRKRQPFLTPSLRPSLHKYIASIFDDNGCHLVVINSQADHVHVLFELSGQVMLCKVIERVKAASSRWLKTQDKGLDSFAWQSGYGAFSVSRSNLDHVREYILNQEEHHRVRTFQDELKALLKKHKIAYDERFLWD